MNRAAALWSAKQRLAVAQLLAVRPRMRIVFILVGVSGLLLVGLSLFEVRVVLAYRNKLIPIQVELDALEQREKALDKQVGVTDTVTEPGASLAQQLEKSVQGIDNLESGWLVAACVGGALFILGTAGTVIESRAGFPKSPPNQS